MRFLLTLSMITMAAGCNITQKGACKTLVLEVCDRCDLSDYEKDVICGCYVDGEIDNVDDYIDDGYFEDEDQAAAICWIQQESLKSTYQTNEDVAECREELSIFKEWGDDACDDLYYNTGD